MKRSVAACLAVVVILCNSVVSWAAVSASFPFITTVDGMSRIGTFSIKDAPAAVKEFWEECVTDFDGTVIFLNDRYDKGIHEYIFSFLRPPSNCTFEFKVGAENFFNMKSSSDIPCIQFIFKGENSVSSVASEVFLISGGRFWNWSFLVGGGHPFISNIPAFVEAFRLDLTTPFMISDDISGEESPDPPPSSSSVPDPPLITPPDPVQPPLDYPSFPKIEDKYIPYDTTTWNGFAYRVRTAIGSSTNIGLQLFAVLVGIFVVIGVVRKFTGGHKGG